MNIFGGPETSKLEFYKEVSFLLQQYEDNKLSIEDTNKTLLLTCGQHLGSIIDAMSRYEDLKILPESLETAARVAVLGIPSYRSHKIKCIKAVRNTTGWGLKEAKDWTEKNYNFDEGRS